MLLRLGCDNHSCCNTLGYELYTDTRTTCNYVCVPTTVIGCLKVLLPEQSVVNPQQLAQPRNSPAVLLYPLVCSVLHLTIRSIRRECRFHGVLSKSVLTAVPPHGLGIQIPPQQTPAAAADVQLSSSLG